MHAYVAGVSVWGPGLPGWAASRAILAGEQPWQETPLATPVPAILSPTERRRTGPMVRLALAAAAEASTMAGFAPGGVRSVFGTGNGDSTVVHAILSELCGAEPMVSPTQFHNSVHNAAAGYWSIGTSSVEPASCVGGHDATFAATLMMAMAEIAAEQVPLLLCVYDLPMPAALNLKRPIAMPFGVALALRPAHAPGSLACLDARYTASPADPATTTPRQPWLQALTHGNPAARALRLMEALACHRADQGALAYLDGRLDVALTPC